MNKKHEKRGLPYGFLLTKVFEIFKVTLGRGTTDVPWFLGTFGA